MVSCQLDIVGEMRNTDAGAGRVVLLSVFYVEESSQLETVHKYRHFESLIAKTVIAIRIQLIVIQVSPNI